MNKISTSEKRGRRLEEQCGGVYGRGWREKREGRNVISL